MLQLQRRREEEHDRIGRQTAEPMMGIVDRPQTAKGHINPRSRGETTPIPTQCLRRPSSLPVLSIPERNPEASVERRNELCQEDVHQRISTPFFLGDSDQINPRPRQATSSTPGGTA